MQLCIHVYINYYDNIIMCMFPLQIQSYDAMWRMCICVDVCVHVYYITVKVLVTVPKE